MGNTNGDPVYSEEAMARIHRVVEETVGGRIVASQRQVRWRPAWFVDIEKDGATETIHLRGDRGGNVAIFPDLKREADIIEVLYDHGIPVPQIHAYVAEPPCIVMESIRGTRDLSDLSDAQKSRVGHEYMAAVAAMHALPVEPFVAIGMDRPEGAQGIALVGLEAYMPQYRRTKARPEPLLEFVIQWIRRNVPRHRDKASFIQFDSGQFLVENGKMTKLYDFEFSMIGDPMVDLATMGMRNTIEPLGAPFPELIRYYEEASGQPVDHDAILFHVLQFSLLGTMQFTGTVANPEPADPHSVYLQFDLALRRSILLALSKLADVPLPELPELAPRKGDNAALMAKLADTVASIGTADELAASQKAQALELVEWAERADAYSGEVVRQDMADVAELLGESFADWPSAEAALERRVLDAEPDEDAALIRLLARIEGRRLQVFGPTSIGEAALNVRLPQTR
ncbi:MAG TPA: phosphotransferase [Croceicoccus sp.]|nr:phosphotransferase [Croceicoccus sp.]